MTRPVWMTKFVPAALMLGLLGCTAGKEEYRDLTDAKELEQMKSEEDHHHHHDEHGPHGGHILELGTYHGEIAMGENRQVSVYILGGDAKTAAPVTGAKVVLALEGSEPITLESSPQEGEADGASSRFVTPAGSVPEAVKDIEAVHGKVILTLDGKETAAEVAHDHGHAH